MRASIVALLASLVALAAGCVLPDVDLTGRRCPCGAGWTCDTARDRCVEGVFDAGGGDAGVEVDAAPLDAAPPADAPAADAYTADAFVGDASAAIDGGIDASTLGETGCTAELASAIVCDGFESEPGPWTGRTDRSGTSATDATHAARGARSLRASTTAAGGQASRSADALGPYTDGDLWGRVSVYIPTSATVIDFTWLYLGETLPPYGGVSLGMGGDGVVGSYSTISGTWVSSSTLDLPRDAWSCLELHLVVSDDAGAIEIYRDGTLRASRTAIDTRPASGFTYFATGIDYTDPLQGPLEVWLDEVVLSRTRLPCP